MLATRSANSLVASSRELASAATARTAKARNATKTRAELWYLGKEGASDMDNTVLGDDNTAVGSDRVERSQRRFVSRLVPVWIIRRSARPRHTGLRYSIIDS